nr:MAG TPA: hypothetical protein [Caudoviricetes sp.]DAY43873.1 MAG TPA: hypothetical protein [Caudoviricetes sp.]
MCIIVLGHSVNLFNLVLMYLVNRNTSDVVINDI